MMIHGPEHTLMTYILQGKFAQASAFLAGCETIDLAKTFKHPKRPEFSGISPLHMVAYFGEYDLLVQLLKKGANVAQTDSYSRTALHYAVMGTHQTTQTHRQNIIHLLIYLKHELLTCYDGPGNLPIHLAALNNQLEIAKILLNYDNEQKFVKNDKTGKTAFNLVEEKMAADQSASIAYKPMLDLLGSRLPSLTYLCLQEITHTRNAHRQISQLPEMLQEKALLYKPWSIEKLDNQDEVVQLCAKVAAFHL